MVYKSLQYTLFYSMEVVSIAKHDTDAVVTATVTKFSESKTQVEEVLQSAGLQ